VASEATIQKQILNWLKSEGFWAVKIMQCNKNGTPDILACIAGVFVGIEVKFTGKIKNVSKIQQYQIEAIESSGGSAFATDSLSHCQNEIRRRFKNGYELHKMPEKNG
jgi:Holliday junction resolvase